MLDRRGKRVRSALLVGVLSTLSVAQVAHANTNQCLTGPVLVPGL